MLTKEDLERKLEILRAAERQAFADFNATMGARQFCEGLLLESEEPERAEGEEPPEDR